MSEGTKLELQSRHGDFVHKGQKMAADKGFKCVSRIWYDKTISLSAGLDKIADEKRERHEILAPAGEFKFRVTDDDKVVLERNDGMQYKPTDWGWRTLAMRCCNISISYVNQMLSNPVDQKGNEIYQRDRRDAESFCEAMNNGYRRLDQQKKFRFRTYKDGTLRAVLSEQYAIIDNSWYLETLQSIFHKLGGDEPRLSHWRGNADTIYGNLLIPDSCIADDDSDYGGMISMSNCEIGLRKLSQYPSIFRAICMNGCIWDQNKGNVIEKMHKGEIDLHDLADTIFDNINTQLPLMGDAVKRFLETKDYIISKYVAPVKVIAEVASKYKLTLGLKGQATRVLEQWVKHEADNRNLFGIINAVTRAGQLYDNSEWVRFDEVAGDMLNTLANTNKWESFLNRSKEITTKEIEKVFGTAGTAA